MVRAGILCEHGFHGRRVHCQLHGWRLIDAPFLFACMAESSSGASTDIVGKDKLHRMTAVYTVSDYWEKAWLFNVNMSFMKPFIMQRQFTVLSPERLDSYGERWSRARRVVPAPGLAKFSCRVLLHAPRNFTIFTTTTHIDYIAATLFWRGDICDAA